ncbi:phosphohydrolase [Weizmannia acidilactici]|uniref:Phosphohydrolase n=1 Tax=Weizmannia acidilactici TaxID=2607726 RepID=A0A5J4JLT3_9BACI|nr:HD domain-containing protein [Weizmannia acidilactici]GER65852.1 phosphohydrolase [Weizmannia acidilactici]GER69964.1 phosphohydrolase [Weizmannia acidilactici]GER73103.1 phosphohydrolase [Weizmannia acidilactici]
MDIVKRAIHFAAKAHDGQYRKIVQLPYIVHPFSVAVILLEAGCRKEIVAAGLLHDTVEDTDVSLDDIKAVFGDAVARIVEGCSEPDKSLPWEERKLHTIDFLKTADESVCLVVCADKIDNLRSIRDDIAREGDKVWSHFKRGKAKQEWYYRNIAASIGRNHAFPLLKQLKTEIDLVFGKM